MIARQYITARSRPTLDGVRAAALVVLLLWPTGCIERSNPFDPVNLRPPIIVVIREQQKAMLDGFIAAGALAAVRLAEYHAAFRRDSIANSARADTNLARSAANKSTTVANAAVADANSTQPDADLLQLQTLLSEQDTLRPYGPYHPLDEDFDSLKTQALAATRLMEAANRDAAPVVIYPPEYRDSVLAPLARDSSLFAAIRSAIGAGNAEVTVANDSIKAYNATVQQANQAIREFNGQVGFLREAKLKGVVIRSDSLTTLAKNTGPGDTLLLGPAEFRVDLRLGSGTKENPILIRGFPGRRSFIMPLINSDGVPINQGVLLDTNKHVIFEDLVFRGGTLSGVKLGEGSIVTFRRCLFEGNRVWGIDASRSHLQLFDCEIRGNGNGLDSGASSGGIRVEMDSDSGGSLQFENVLIAYNLGFGIEAVSPNGSILRATLAYNTRDGLRLSTHDRHLEVSHSILAFNGGYGVWRIPSPTNPDGLVVRDCDLWGNLPEDWHLRTLAEEKQAVLIKANFYEDPAFIDPVSFDFRPKPGSPLADLETRQLVPVIVGYRPRP